MRKKGENSMKKKWKAKVNRCTYEVVYEEKEQDYFLYVEGENIPLECKFDENNTPMVQHFEIDGVECTLEFDQNQPTLYVRNFNVDQKKYRLSNKALCILVAFALLTAICAVILYKAGCELTDLLILFALYMIIPQILIRVLK